MKYEHPNDKRTELVSFRLNVDDRRGLDKLAKKAGLSISDLIRKWISDALEKERGKK